MDDGATISVRYVPYVFATMCMVVAAVLVLVDMRTATYRATCAECDAVKTKAAKRRDERKKRQPGPGEGPDWREPPGAGGAGSGWGA